MGRRHPSGGTHGQHDLQPDVVVTARSRGAQQLVFGIRFAGGTVGRRIARRFHCVVFGTDFFSRRRDCGIVDVRNGRRFNKRRPRSLRGRRRGRGRGRACGSWPGRSRLGRVRTANAVGQRQRGFRRGGIGRAGPVDMSRTSQPQRQEQRDQSRISSQRQLVAVVVVVAVVVYAQILVRSAPTVPQCQPRRIVVRCGLTTI